MVNILTFVPVYLPGYKSGGPVRTVSNMVASLGDDFYFHVVCQDRDLGDVQSFSGISVHDWCRVGKASVFYIKSGLGGLIKIYELISNKNFAIIHLNSFFSFRFGVLPLFFAKLLRKDRSVILGPRGEFSVGALAIKSNKKRVFIWLAKFIGFYNNVIWHASTEREADDIRRVIGINAYIRIATDIAYPAENIDMSLRQSNSPLRIVSISRISPMKNLLGAIGYLQEVKVPVVFDVYGPIEDCAYWSECQIAIKQLPVEVKFNYCSTLFPTQVPDVMSNYDLFLLPTLGENFGHAIAEALGVGLPVLISDQTPWRDLYKNSLGWDLPLNMPSRFVNCIEDCYHKPADEYNTWRLSIRKWALLNIGNSGDVDQSRQLFMNLDRVNLDA